MPERHGYKVDGGWAEGGDNVNGTNFPQNLTINNRNINGEPVEYKASQSIEFFDGFESSSVDEFLAFIANGSSYAGGTTSGNGGESNSYRYGFNGQEKSTEIEPNESSYNAEFWQYDARLGRRWNLDPRPNVSFSPYNTFAGNPIFYRDPLGDTIIVNAHIPTSSDPNSIQPYLWYNSKEGQGFHDVNGKLADLTELTRLDPRNQYLKDVNAALGLLYLSKAGGNLINKITILSDTRIDPSNINSTNPEGGLIGWNSSLNIGGLDENGSPNRPAFIGLAHELRHEYNNLIGASLGSIQTWATKDDNGNPLPSQVNNDEISVTHFENQIRAAFGYPLRTHYAHLPGGEPIRSTRLINTKKREALYVDQDEKFYYSPLPKGILPYKY